MSVDEAVEQLIASAPPLDQDRRERLAEALKPPVSAGGSSIPPEERASA